jgi:hypothetical protein
MVEVLDFLPAIGPHKVGWIITGKPLRLSASAVTLPARERAGECRYAATRH